MRGLATTGGDPVVVVVLANLDNSPRRGLFLAASALLPSAPPTSRHDAKVQGRRVQEVGFPSKRFAQVVSQAANRIC